ncbi:hypothetical protein NHQ30_001810 [Ciborinia camelliae]|nr:hypothetical protein NHQ30_001810 [Ciborinia camelliae]
MSLYYPELNKEQVKQIFKLNLEIIEIRFMAQSRQLAFDDPAIISFAELYFNNHEHAIGMTAYLAFAKYLGDVFGTDGDKTAEENCLKARAGQIEAKRAADKSHTSFKSHQKKRRTTNNYAQSTGLPWSNAPFNQSAIMHYSQGTSNIVPATRIARLKSKSGSISISSSNGNGSTTPSM